MVDITDALHRFHRFCGENPVTPTIGFIVTLVLVLQVLFLPVNPELFVAQYQFDLGLILAPFSHGSFLHMGTNVGLLLFFMWPSEEKLGHKNILFFTIGVAYLSTWSQVIISHHMTGTAGTLGISGAVYAFPPFLAIIMMTEFRESFSNFFSRALTLSAIMVTLAIPIDLLGYLDLGMSGGADAATITHAVGLISGILYGTYRSLNTLSVLSSKH